MNILNWKNIQLKINKLRKFSATWFLENERQILLIIGFVIVAALSFVFGTLKGAGITQSPIIVEKPVGEPLVIKELCADSVMTREDCIYVGSVKGTKYYPPDCSYAKKISKENLRCFKTDEEAMKKGYKKSTSCK